MAAFINALAEEGTLDECRQWVQKMRREVNKKFSSKGSTDMGKDECISEISKLFDLQVAMKKELDNVTQT